MCYVKVHESAFVKVNINLYFAIIFLYQSVAFGKMDHSFLLLSPKIQFPLLNVDFHRPEIQTKTRNGPHLEATGLTSHDLCCNNSNRTGSSYILKIGKVGGFGACAVLPPTQSSPKF